jgi:hypothetical protein
MVVLLLDFKAFQPWRLQLRPNALLLRHMLMGA